MQRVREPLDGEDRRQAGTASAGSATPKPIQPIATSAVAIVSETAIAVSARPPISTQAGTGVARRRFSTPDSRWVTTEITRFVNDEAITESATSPGT